MNRAAHSLSISSLSLFARSRMMDFGWTGECANGHLRACNLNKILSPRLLNRLMLSLGVVIAGRLSGRPTLSPPHRQYWLVAARRAATIGSLPA